MTHDGTTPPPAALLQQTDFLRALTRGLLGDEHASEDAVQATWLASLERPRSDVRNPRAFLARIAARTALKLSRSEARRTAREHASARPEAQPSTAELVEREHTLRAVTEAVLGLEEPWRSTILARHYEGLEARDIAERDGLPLGTVRSRIARGHELLRDELDREHGGDRQAWSLGLVALVGGRQLGRVGAGVGAGGSVAGTALIMSSQVKSIAIALGVVLGLAGLWFGSFALLHQAPEEFVASAAVRVPPDRGGREVPVASKSTPSPAERESNRVASIGRDPAAAHAGALRLSVQWWDGSPAANVTVKVHAYASDSTPQPVVYVRTDGDGEALASDLAAGSYGLYGQRGGYALATVEPGAEAQVALKLARGIQIHGRVVDVDGNPVPHADIWLSDPGNGSRGLAVDRADSSGRFTLRDVSDQNSVSARKDGHAPAPSFWIEGAPGDTREVELVLQGPGAGLALRVLDPQGAAVTGATVRLIAQEFHLRGYRDGRPKGVSLQRPIPYSLTTDAEGRCEATSLLAGPMEVRVGHHLLASSELRIELPEGRRTSLEVRLSAGAVVSGVVRTPDGKPLEAAGVRVGSFGAPGSRSAVTGADGRYELAGLAPGSIEIEVDHADMRRLRATLAGADGEHLVWDPVIDTGRRVLGQLLDEHGNPLAGWRVHLGKGGHGWDGPPEFRANLSSDSEGRFQASGCPEGLLWVRVTPDRGASAFQTAQWEDVAADGEEHTYVVPTSTHPSAHVQGRVLGIDGRAVSAKLTLSHPTLEPAHVTWSDPESGFFHIGPLPPASYALALEDLASEASAQVGDLLLTQAQERDLGEIRLGGPGSLSVNVQAAADVDQRQVQLIVSSRSAGGRFVASLPAHGDVPALELPAGHYELSPVGNVAPRVHPFSIEPDSTTKVDVSLERGVTAQVLIQLPAGRSLPIDLELLFRADDGTEHRREAYLRLREDMPEQYSRYVSAVLAAKGGYSLEVTGPDGLRGSAYLDAARLNRAPGRDNPPLEVVLR